MRMSSSFLSLPPEIRNRIYEAVLLPPPELVMRVGGIAPRAMSVCLSRGQRSKMYLEILRTCRQIFAEAKPILLGNQQRPFPSLRQPLNPDNTGSFLDSWNIVDFYMVVPRALGCPEMTIADPDGLHIHGWGPCVSKTLFIVMELSKIHKYKGRRATQEPWVSLSVSEEEKQDAIDVLCDYLNLVVNMKTVDELPGVEHVDISVSSYSPDGKEWIDAWVRRITNGEAYNFREWIRTPQKLYSWEWTWDVKAHSSKQQNSAHLSPVEGTGSVQEPKIQPSSHRKLQNGEPARSLEGKINSILKQSNHSLCFLSPPKSRSFYSSR